MVSFYISFENYFFLICWLIKQIYIQKKKRHKSSDLFGIKLNYSRFMQTKQYEWLLLTTNLPWLYHYLWRQCHIHCLTFYKQTNKKTSKNYFKRRIAQQTFDYGIFVIKFSCSWNWRQTNNRMKSIMVKKKWLKILEKYLKCVFIFARLLALVIL